MVEVIQFQPVNVTYQCLYCDVQLPRNMMRPSNYVNGYMVCTDHDACMLRIHQTYHVDSPCEDCSACEYEQHFGRKTGMHTHPVTHPSWMSFQDGNCPVC